MPTPLLPLSVHRDQIVDSSGKYLGQAALAGYVATLMQPAFATSFQGLSETQIDDILQSFAFANCTPHKELVDILRQRMVERALTGVVQ